MLTDWNDAMIVCPECGDDSSEDSVRFLIEGREPKQGERRIQIHQMSCGCVLRSSLTFYAETGWV